MLAIVYIAYEICTLVYSTFNFTNLRPHSFEAQIEIMMPLI